jgi:hypothetical protein
MLTRWALVCIAAGTRPHPERETGISDLEDGRSGGKLGGGNAGGIEQVVER